MIRKYLPVALLALGIGALQARAAAAANTDDLWIHIRVLDAKDGRVSINLPISVVERMGNVMPADTQGDSKLRFNDEDITVSELREIWTELRKRPDATFIDVEETDSKVRVGKVAGDLVVRAIEGAGGRDEKVEMKIPGSVVDALLSAPGEQLNVGAALKALAREGEGEIVTVTGEGESVRIWIDANAESQAR